MASLLSFFSSTTSSILQKPRVSITKACSDGGGGGATTTLSPPPEETDFEQQFARKGIKFSGSEEVELTVRNGSSLRLRIQDGHVTSYKPKVNWKQNNGFEELLYTIPSDDDDESKSKSKKGGIGLVMNDVSEPNSKPSPVITSPWTLKDVDSDSIDALQVELGCNSGSLDIRYVVSLYPVSMATAVIVKNNGRKAVKMTGGILNHFKFKKRGGTAIQGLRSCSYCTHPPLSSPFEVLSPSNAMKSDEAAWFSFGSSETELKPGVWTVQDVPITVLKNKLSRVYAAPPTERSKQFYNSAPSKYETIDQGRGLFFRIIKIGFEDIYVSSPGSFSHKYGKDYFICTGSASMLVPLIVNPGEEWRAAQVIEHDNL